jgi:hypothetical protein
MTATCKTFVRRAMKKIGVLARSAVPTDAEYTDGIAELRSMLDTWRLEGLMIYSRSLRSFSLLPGRASYTYGEGGNFDAPRPTSIESATIRDDAGLAWPLAPITDVEYSRLYNRSTVARPTRFYFRPSYPIAEVRFDTIPDGDNVEFAVMDELELPANPDEDIDFPPGYEDCIVYNLGLRLCPDFSVDVPRDVLALAGNFAALIKRKNLTIPTSFIDGPHRKGALGTYDITQGPG